MRYTPSRVLSLTLSAIYHGVFLILIAERYSLLTAVIAIVVIFPNFAFWLDRLRQYMEHNVMPLNVVDGARDLGLDFWGMLIGGGPWGQPCHWSHHLYPGVPWYNQLRLHRFIGNILTLEQKEVFFLKPLVGFPQKLFWVVKTTEHSL